MIYILILFFLWNFVNLKFLRFYFLFFCLGFFVCFLAFCLCVCVVASITILTFIVSFIFYIQKDNGLCIFLSIVTQHLER